MLLKDLYNVAFDTNTTVIKIVSFNKTIDANIGVYNNMMTVNLAPSNSKIDWLINFTFLLKTFPMFRHLKKPSYAKKDSKVRVHSGYLNEWMKYRESFFNIIRADTTLMIALSNGLIVTGRSKGGGESSIIALDIVRNFNVDKEKCYVLQAEAPKIGNKEYVKSVYKYINKKHIYHVCYGNDIVTKIVPWYYNPGLYLHFGKGKYWLSIQDHVTGCFYRNILDKYITEYDNSN